MYINIKGRFKNGKFRIIEENSENKLTNQLYYDIIKRVKNTILSKDLYLKYSDIIITFREDDKIKRYKFIINTKYDYNKNISVFSKSIYNSIIQYSKGELFNEEQGEKSLQSRSTSSIQSKSGCNTGVCRQGSRESIRDEKAGKEAGGTGYGPLSSITQCKERGKDSDSLSLLLYERPVKAEASKFREAILNYRSLNPYSAAVDVHDLSEYFDMSCYLYDDGKAGIAVQPSGNIVSVFKTKDSKLKKFAIKSTKDAIENGGTKLDCYSINGFLPNQYMQAGMRPICKIRFNKEFAPDGWDFERDGEPDIVFMTIGNNIHDIYQEYTDEEVPYIEDSETECAYDLAEKYRDKWIKEQISSKRNLEDVNKFMSNLGNLIVRPNKKKGK